MATASLGARLSAAGISTAIAVLACWAWAGTRTAPLTRVVDNSSTVGELLLGRRGSPSDADAGDRLPRGPLTEEEAARLFPLYDAPYVFDPRSYYRYRPGYVERVEWIDHPRGRWIRRTNGAGLRMDAEIADVPPDLRVLVVGDSHTDGVCENSESFCSRLQELLAQRRPPRTVEVLNAAVMGYSFYNYLGAVENHMALAPRVVVVAFFSGNDFLEVIDLMHFFERTLRPPRAHGYWERVKKASKLSTQSLTQGINQALYFQQYPDEIELAFRGARLACAEIERVCRAGNAQAIFVHIPSAFDTSRPEAQATLEQLRAALELSEHDLHVGARLAERLVGELRDGGSAVLDLSADIQRASEACYWEDFHINLATHERIAGLLLPRVEAAASAAAPVR